MKSTVETVTLQTPMGPMRAAATDRGISRLEFKDGSNGVASAASSNPHLKKLRAELDQYFAGKLREFSVPVDPSGTEFQDLAWEQLRRIPYGETISYKEEARRMGNEKGAQAVGQANHANPICILIPCHRVIAADGSLGGYGAGPRRKERLLALERDGVLPPS